MEALTQNIIDFNFIKTSLVLNTLAHHAYSPLIFIILELHRWNGIKNTFWSTNIEEAAELFFFPDIAVALNISPFLPASSYYRILSYTWTITCYLSEFKNTTENMQ